MSVTARLIYDPAAASSSASIGSHTLAGDDGTQIGHVSDALKVNFSNTTLAVTSTDLDIRNLVFATDKIDVTGSEVSLSSGTLAALENITVSATDLDIRNLVFATDKVDVSGSAVSITGTVGVTQSTSPWVVSATDLDIRDLTHVSDSIKVGDGTDFLAVNNDGSINVAITSGFTDVDDSLANTAIFNEALAVSTTAISVTAAAALAGRKWLYLANEGNKALFFGMATGLTAANGFPMHPGQQSEFRCGAALAPKIIGEAGASSEDLRVMQLS